MTPISSRRPSPWPTGLLAISFLLATGGPGTTRAAEDAPDWTTPAERSDFGATPSYDETLAWLQALARTTPTADLQSFGRSPQGRQLPLLVVSAQRTFEPGAARAAGRPVILIQCGIHSGEISGKDASLIFLRELLVEGRFPEVLGELTLLFVPIYNVDGHERLGHSRINQDGPREGMGFRTTARGQDLNRDYMKLDAEETRALVGTLIARWDPHLMVDLHATDGAQHRIQVSYAVGDGPLADPSVAAWANEVVAAVIDPMEEAGRPVAQYVFGQDRREPEKGFLGGFSSPRLSTSYMALRGRAGILVEAHSLKPYETRVRAVRDYLALLLQEVAARSDALVEACAEADRRTVQEMAAGAERPSVPVRMVRSDRTRPFVFRTYEFQVVDGQVAEEPYVAYGEVPLDIEAPLKDQLDVELEVTAPVGYLIPPQYGDLIRRLELHGFQLQELQEPARVDVEMVRLPEVEFADRSYQGRQRADVVRWEVEEHAGRSFPAGTRWLPLDQPAARVAIHLLEPVAPDSFFAWGLLSGITERKEYFERYVMEPMAQEMLADDDELREEFERRLEEDEEFAGNPWARLEYFYRRTEHADPDWCLHPIGRVMEPLPAGVALGRAP